MITKNINPSILPSGRFSLGAFQLDGSVEGFLLI